ncbi:bifunctional DNA primase/polymerase [Rhodococcus sp. NPDC006774]|uniref:bifunctional DNA primase/polymerase n=1 Tax=Rhodococcus sp. NPDC006774 TaxID=3157186 RepID=UPI0033E69AE1
MIDMYAWAHRYVNDGFEVVCLMPGSIHPLSRSGVDSATRNHDIVHDLWTRTPTANIGLRVPKGHVLLKVDPSRGGSMWDLKELGATMTSKTAMNTWEVLYRAPGLQLMPANCGSAIQSRGRNGLLVVEPSSLQAGGRYRWFDMRRPVQPSASSFARLGLVTSPGRRNTR